MRIGIIGAGVIGRLRAQSVRDNPRTSLAGVMDLSEPAARAIAGDAPVFTALDPFLDSGLDAVIVSTPPAFHEEACIAAFARGLHVLVEKPLSNSVEGGRRIVAAAQAAGRALGVGFDMRYYPAFAFVKQAVAAGRIGALDHVRVFGGHGGLANFRADWQYRAPASGGGALWDVGIHMTDLARWLMGEISFVSGIASERVWQVPGSEDNAIAILKSPDGIAAICQATWGEWTGYRCVLEAYGTGGMVRGAYAPMQNLLVTQERPGGAQRTERWRYPRIMVREKLKSWTDTALRAFAAELEDFLGLAEGRQGLGIADGHAGLRAIEIAAAVAESSRSGAPVHLPALGPLAPPGS